MKYLVVLLVGVQYWAPLFPTRHGTNFKSGSPYPYGLARIRTAVSVLANTDTGTEKKKTVRAAIKS